MKIYFYLATFLFIFSQNAFAQNTPESYLNGAPAIPKSICTASFEDVTSFNNQIQTLSTQIKKDAEGRTEALSGDAGREKVAKQYLRNTGLSAKDIERLQNDNMSDADASALAARIAAGQSTNTPSKPAEDIRRESGESKNTFAFSESYMRQKENLSNAQKQYHAQHVLPIETEKPLSSGSMAAQKKWDVEHHKKLLNARKSYCEKFSPRRTQMIEALKSSIKKEMNKVRKEESKQLAAVGADNQDILLLNMVDSYLGELKEVYTLNVTDYRK